MQNIIFWFRNDLRLHDNEAFLKASQAGNVIPVYIFDERNFEKRWLGFKKTGVFRAKFLIEAIEDLRKSLQNLGSNLVVKIGKPEEILALMAKDFEAEAVFASKECTQEETDIEANLSKKLKPLNIDIELIWTATLYHVRDIPFNINQLPDIYTNFRIATEKQAKVRKTFDAPENLPSLPENLEIGEIPSFQDLDYENELNFDERSVLKFIGGETEGLKRLQEFIWEKDLLKTYKETRNGMIGGDYSTKLSAWLSLGCISPRKVYEEVKRYEVERVKNDSTYWLVFELIWRDYFHLIALKYGTRLFKPSGIKFDLKKKWKRDREVFLRWANGETGVPLIDANMRELQATGFMSNRGRQNVASYLTKDLGLDWTWGATYFESQLIDYDVCINWGNWNYIAGVGNDPREDRYFNTKKQTEMYDPKGEYIKLWSLST